MRRALLLCLLAAACNRTRESGFDVTVNIESGATSRCVQVAVKHPGQGELRTGAMPSAGRMAVYAGIARGALPATIRVYAQGFSDDACTTLTDPPERTKELEATFEAGKTLPLTLELLASSPSREFACADGLDSDADGLTDCADSDCDGQPCAGGGRCETAACRGAATEAGLCGDGADNDGDTAVDCVDSDCLAATCVSADKCTADPRCDGAHACIGAPKTCTSPGTCRLGPGTCEPSTGQCRYDPLDAGSTCDDFTACTSADRCDGAGACVGDAVTCGTPPGACFTATNASCDLQRGCLYPVAPTATCDDLVNCTVQDQCAADGGCAGTPVTCIPGECQMPGTGCAIDGGCRFGIVDAGLPCDAGVCNGAGACIVRFPYPPSNFTESQLPTPPSGDVTLGCGVSTVDTGASGAPVFGNWCAQPLPGVASIAQPGGREAVLLSFTRLTVAAGATLRSTGARPVIIAGTNEVLVAGLVDARAGALDCAGSGAGLAGAEGTTNGGGGGGSFATAGGAGGAGSPPFFGMAGAGGDAGPVDLAGETLVPLRGGCPGALGAHSTSTRAAGGGAVQISSAGALNVSGAVTAAGEGGPSSGNGTGGNGAGSGGGILLEAVQLTVSGPAAITAHGGGGGEGAGPIFGGQPGSRGTADGGVAGGGTSLNSGGPGGAGAVQGVAATNGGVGTVGTGNGGGGGGGLGRLRVRASVGCSIGAGAALSPAFNADGGC